MLRRFAILFPLLALLVVLPAPLRADDEPLEKAPTRKANIAIRLPHGWLPDEHPLPHTILVARVPQRDKDDVSDFQALLAIASGPGNTVDGAAQQARLAKEIPSYKVVEKPTRLTIGGIPGVTFGGTFTNGPLQLRTRQYMLCNNFVYILTFTSLESHWLDYAGLLEASIDTLSFTDKK